MKNRELSIAFQTDKRAADYIALAELVNDYAFHAVTVYCDAPYHPSYLPLLLMAPQIKRARIGPAGIPPSRMHPLDIAAGAALLADIANAGTYIGLVRGGWLAEHGIRELRPPIQAMRESVNIIQRLLAGETALGEGDNRASHRLAPTGKSDTGQRGIEPPPDPTGGPRGVNRVFKIAPHVRAPYPLPSARIPLQIGAWGAKMAALAGEVADEVKIGGTANPALVPWMARQIAVGEARAEREIGGVNIVIGAVSVVDEDRDAARFAARKAVALYMPIVSRLDPTANIEPELMGRVSELVAAGESDAAARLVPDDLLESFAFAGDAADIIAQCERLYDAGAQRIELGTPHGVNDSARGIQIIGEKVIPALGDWMR